MHASHRTTALLAAGALVLAACGAARPAATAPVPDTPAGLPPQAASRAAAGTAAAAASLNSRLLAQVSPAAAEADLPIGPGDLVEVSVFEVDELSKLRVRVPHRGTITLPLLGGIPAAGTTTLELQEEIHSRLQAKYMHDPQVSVFVVEHRSQRISVIGAVRRGGVYPMTTRLRLADALALAEGLADDADHVVYLIRRVPAGPLARADATSDATSGATSDATFDATPAVPPLTSAAAGAPAPQPPDAAGDARAPLPVVGMAAAAAPPGQAAPAPAPTVPAGPAPSAEAAATPTPAGAAAPRAGADEEVEVVVAIDLEALAGGREELNVLLRAGDVIQVPRAGSYFVGGSVERPGAFLLKSRTTLQGAIAAAGGVTDTADWRDVRIYRAAPGGGREVLELDLAAIEAGAPAPEIRTHDVIVVGKSYAKAFLYGVADFFKGIFGFSKGL